jgi:hypothetical protein
MRQFSRKMFYSESLFVVIVDTKHQTFKLSFDFDGDKKICVLDFLCDFWLTKIMIFSLFEDLRVHRFDVRVIMHPVKK